MKRFLYKDSFNRTTEANNYEPSDFISSYSPTGASKPIITGLDGLIDASLIPAAPASSLQLTRIAQEAITKGDNVYSVSNTHVGVADYNLTLAKAMVLGVAANDALAGENVLVVVLGVINDSIFNIFAVNRPLYLDAAGGMTDEKPTAGYLVPVGKSLGSGYIIINPGYPSRLGV